MAAPNRRVWSNRRGVLAAAAALLFAHLLVKTVSLARLRRLLDRPSTAPGDRALDVEAARTIGRQVERAGMRLPIHTKCLPRAVAAMWLLSRHRLAGQLVIAVHRHDRAGEHAFHAWVEHAGEIVIGHCVRAEYAPVMTIGNWEGGC
jgi:hypothetical protein